VNVYQETQGIALFSHPQIVGKCSQSTQRGAQLTAFGQKIEVCLTKLSETPVCNAGALKTQEFLVGVRLDGERAHSREKW